jgi:Wnt-binding factor required for Wnt secretion.
MDAIIRLCLGLIVVGIVFLTVFAIKSKQKKHQEKDPNQQGLMVHVSKKGSIIFYSFLVSLFIFLFVMYIIYRMKY